MSGPENDKRDLRKQALDDRRCLSSHQVGTVGEAIAQHLLDCSHWPSAHRIHTYVDALPGEIPTRDIIAAALQTQRMVVIPVVGQDRGLRHHHMTDLDDLQRGLMNLWEPQDPRWIDDLTDLDLILVPGAVFDKDGYRIGLGGGYYDRLLADLPPTTLRIGIAYDAWVRDKVPRQSHDQPVDLIITEKGIRFIGDR
ncbi:MAG: 5-formyltetrahydrofolate cyclo-ligase [Candidatus Latescibacteria bacterium]|jgi:5-formyltetrahydrofolate cyclo-ligase|nr:5-formyltetrahydrofolate cyclo-ligase [Candidatus Latescibacterota bacterium]